MILIVKKLSKNCLQSFCNIRHNLELTGIPKNKITQLEDELQNINWNNVKQTHDLDTCCTTMMKTLTDVIQKYTQLLKYPQCRRALPWLNKDIFQLMKKRHIHYYIHY